MRYRGIKYANGYKSKIPSYTLHKPARYRFRRNRVIVGAMDVEWEADLVIMDSLSQKNNGYKYVLTVIDILSKYVWVEAIKAKTGNNLVKAFEKIIKKGRKPKMFHSGVANSILGGRGNIHIFAFCLINFL
jgi:hypothetical protein